MKNKNVIVTTKDNKSYQGSFHGYFKGEVKWGEDCILSWRFILLDDSKSEIMIEQTAIRSVKFMEDNSQLKF